MRVLIGCEESQVVCKAFRALGHEAYSCDLQECSGPIKREMIKAIDFFGNEADCKEYWMEENEIELFKKKTILK